MAACVRVQVLSSSLDGTLRQWDVQEGTALQTWAVRDPIESMVGPLVGGGSGSGLRGHKLVSHSMWVRIADLGCWWLRVQGLGCI